MCYANSSRLICRLMCSPLIVFRTHGYLKNSPLFVIMAVQAPQLLDSKQEFQALLCPSLMISLHGYTEPTI